MQPTRDTFADELRGFALLGIGFVNAPFLGISAEGFSQDSVATWYDRAAALLTVALAQGKFYLLFAFLFGYSLRYIIKNDRCAARRFKRRLIGLGLIGIFHAIFLFVGDILLLYGVIGIGLLWLRHQSDRVALRTCFVALAAWVGLLILVVLAAWNTPAPSPEGDEAMRAAQAFDAAMREASFWDASGARLGFWPWAATLIAMLNGPAVIAMFSLGLVAGRRRLLANPAAHAVLWQRGIRWGLGLGLPLSAISAWLAVGPGTRITGWGQWESAGIALGFITAPLLSWGYIACLARWHLRSAEALAFFRPAGRMSLTGYLGESLLLSLLFAAYGAGLYGKLGAAAVALAALLVWAVLDLFAHLIQKRWASGPLESLLRWFSSA
jgi:uncharacterized protein